VEAATPERLFSDVLRHDGQNEVGAHDLNRACFDLAKT